MNDLEIRFELLSVLLPLYVSEVVPKNNVRNKCKSFSLLYTCKINTTHLQFPQTNKDQITAYELIYLYDKPEHKQYEYADNKIG